MRKGFNLKISENIKELISPQAATVLWTCENSEPRSFGHFDSVTLTIH